MIANISNDIFKRNIKVFMTDLLKIRSGQYYVSLVLETVVTAVVVVAN